MSIQIEEGKFYRTRLGSKIGPMKRLPSSDARHFNGYVWYAPGGDRFTDRSFTTSGHRLAEHFATVGDLVAEWTDETPQQVADRELADYQDAKRGAEPEWDEDLIRRLSVAKNREAVHAPVGMSNATLAAHIEETRRRVLAGAQNGVYFADNAPGEQQKDEPGWKQDGGKVRLDLIAPEFLFGVSEILTFGAAKYSERNWEKGMSWGRCFGAMMRHMWAWWAGETNDRETGKPHLWHAGCCLMFLAAYEARKVGTDDRAKISPRAVDGASEV